MSSETLKRKQIFDGTNTVVVEVCCSGAVLLREVHVSQAHRYMVAAPELAESALVCKDCGKVLHKVK